MKRDVQVGSVVIDWPEEAMEITDRSGAKYIIPLYRAITVTMLGFPSREEKTLLAGELNEYMMSGYVIERIIFVDQVGAYVRKTINSPLQAHNFASYLSLN